MTVKAHRRVFQNSLTGPFVEPAQETYEVLEADPDWQALKGAWLDAEEELGPDELERQITEYRKDKEGLLR